MKTNSYRNNGYYHSYFSKKRQETLEFLGRQVVQDFFQHKSAELVDYDKDKEGKHDSNRTRFHYEKKS